MKQFEIIFANQEDWINRIAEIDKGKDMTTVVNEHSLEIQNLLFNKSLSVKQLRECVAWANNLDMEATMLDRNGDLTSKLELDEYTARRVSHRAGRLVLNKVKTIAKYETTLSLYNRGII